VAVAAANPTNADDAEIARLAAMNVFDYDREREAVAKRLGVRIRTLDDEVMRARKTQQPQELRSEAGHDVLKAVEPWPDPVDGVALCDDIARELRRFVVLPPGAAPALRYGA
jgi:hypothetical protein